MFQKYHWYNLALRKKAKWCSWASLIGIVGIGLAWLLMPTKITGANIGIVLVFVVALQWYSSKLRRQDMRESRRYK